VDWDIVQRLWDYGMKERLRIDPKDHPVLLIEPASVSKATREREAELMFETYQVPAFFLAKESALSCFAAARDKGLVIDAGGAKTTATCVHDGYALRQTCISSPVGGESLTDAVLSMLQSKNVTVRPRYSIRRTETAPGEFQVEDLVRSPTVSYHRAMVRIVARDLKEAVCCVAEQPWSVIANNNVSAVAYELPDGKKIELTAQRFEIPERLFVAPVAADAVAGAPAGDVAPRTVHGVANASVRRADVDLQRELFSNVIVCGGNAQLPGFGARLEMELRQLCPPQTKLKLVAANFANERLHAPWIGGSILASLGSFQQLWVSKAEYEDLGGSVVEKKCP